MAYHTTNPTHTYYDGTNAYAYASYMPPGQSSQPSMAYHSLAPYGPPGAGVLVPNVTQDDNTPTPRPQARNPQYIQHSIATQQTYAHVAVQQTSYQVAPAASSYQVAPAASYQVAPAQYQVAPASHQVAPAHYVQHTSSVQQVASANHIVYSNHSFASAAPAPRPIQQHYAPVRNPARAARDPATVPYGRGALPADSLLLQPFVPKYAQSQDEEPEAQEAYY